MVDIGTATLVVHAGPSSSAGAVGPAALAPALGPIGSHGGHGIGAGIFGAATRAIGPLALITAGVLVAGAVTSWAKTAVNHLGEVEALAAQTAAAIESTGGAAGVTGEHVADLANHLKNLTGTSDEAIQGGANLLLTFKNIRNEVGEGNDIFDQATEAMVNVARAMGTDPQSAALQLGKALNDPIAGLTALGRQGIQFSDDQKAMIQSLVDTGDVMGAQKIILGELQAQFGGSGAAYVQTFPGKIALLSEAWEDFGDAVFSKVMPALGAIVTGLTGLINNTLIPAVDVVSSFGDGLATVFADAGGGASGFQAVLGSLGDTLADYLTGDRLLGLLTDGLEALWRLDVTLYRDVLPAALSLYFDRWVPAIYAGATTLFGVIVGALPVLVPQLVGTLVSVATLIVDVLVTQVPVLLAGAVQLFTGLLAGLVAVYPKVYVALVSLLPVIASTLVSLAPLILAYNVQTFTALADALPIVLPLVVVALIALVTQLVPVVSAMVVPVLQAAVDLFIALVDAIPVILPLLTGAIQTLLPAIIMATLTMIPPLLAAAVQVFNALVRAVAVITPALLTAVADVAGGLVDSILAIAPEMLSAGVAIIQTFIDGIGSMVGTAVDAISGVVGAVLDLIPHSPAPSGPLSGAGWRSLRDDGATVGESFADSIADTRWRMPDIDPDTTSLFTVQDDTERLLDELLVAAKNAAARPAGVSLYDARGALIARLPAAA